VEGLKKEWEGRVDENFDWILKEVGAPGGREGRRACARKTNTNSSSSLPPSLPPSLPQALPPLTSRLLDVEDSTQHFAHSILPPAIEASLLLEGGREGGVEAARKAWEAEKSKVKKRWVWGREGGMEGG
jgi:hypothetical protein